MARPGLHQLAKGKKVFNFDVQSEGLVIVTEHVACKTHWVRCSTHDVKAPLARKWWKKLRTEGFERVLPKGRS